MAASVLVVGGGISGLVTAHRLLQADPAIDVEVLEAAGRAGGTMGTEIIEDFVFERGPNGFLDSVPHTVDLARELGLGERLLASAPAARRRYILKGGRLQAIPSRPLDLVQSKLLSVRGKLRLLAEPFQPGAVPEIEDSVAAFGRRRLGGEATSTFLDPMVTGIYAGDAERLSLPAAFPRIAALEREHGSLIRGMLRQARERRRASRAAAATAPVESGPAPAAASEPAGGPGGPGGRLLSFPRGLEELIHALAGKLGKRLRLGTAVDAVRGRADGYEAVLRHAGMARARAVVIAMPAPRAASLVSAWKPDLAMALEEFPYAPVAVVCLGYRRPDVEHPLDGFGFLVPRGEGLRTLGAIWVSSIYPAHVPPGAVSLRFLVGGARDPEAVGLAEDELIALVVRETGPVLGLNGEPVATRVYRYFQGIPQYNLGHTKRVGRVDGWLRRTPGLFVSGNAYRGVGINDCVADGARVAKEVLGYLGGMAGAA